MTHELMNLKDKLESFVDDIFSDYDTIAVYADKIGLDFRAGCVTISKEGGFIATTNSRTLEYYGGFEYVKSEDKITIGEWTFYFDSSSRVESALDYFYDENEDDEEDIDAEEDLNEENQ